MKKVLNKRGYVLSFNATLQFMDDELREDLHLALAPCPAQRFLTCYEVQHEKKFGEEWFLSDRNPTW
ncbi:MAG: hypothetical protein GX780_07355 [Campylobacteraceae bacterium]|nr:hypothetical protein [Campylobacteraceae bacterium]